MRSTPRTGGYRRRAAPFPSSLQPARGFIVRAAVSPGRRPGGSAAFADPFKNALDADVFWRRADYVHILSAYVRRADDPGFGRIISLGGLACERAIFEAADGEQHLLLRTASE